MINRDFKSLRELIKEVLQEVSLTALSSVNVDSWLRLNALEYLLRKGSPKSNDRHTRRHRERGRKEGNVSDRDESELKRSILSDLCNAYKCDNPELKNLLNNANEILNTIRRGLESNGYYVLELSVETKSKLLVGVSEEIFGKPIFEVGLMWNPLLNLPYIPASSIKGAFRSYLELKGIKIDDHVVDDILGSQSRRSYIVFVDSYPISCRTYLLVPEVTTPIYQELEGKIQETKAQPIPVIYPAINEGVRFRILVGIRKDLEKDEEKLKILKTELMKFLTETLKQGIGAKTMLGYGILE